MQFWKDFTGLSLHILEGQGSNYTMIYTTLPNRQSVHDSLWSSVALHMQFCEGQPAHIH
jgi:hypothetical protein